MSKEKDIAVKAAREAGQLILQKMNDKKIDHKGTFNNLVTDADKAAEAIILDIIKKEFPNDEFLAEESGKSGAKGTRRWLVDPIDGTTNFAHNYPFFCVSIALEEAGKLKTGVVFNPVANELFCAEEGKGAWLNDKPIKVSKIDKLESSLLATGFSTSVNANMERFQRLTSITHGVRRDGSAALDLCFVACGRTEGYWELRIAAWDVGAGILMIREAGGQVTSIGGDQLDLSTTGFNILASNGLIHKELISSLAQAESAGLK